MIQTILCSMHQTRHRSTRSYYVRGWHIKNFDEGEKSENNNVHVHKVIYVW